MKSLPVLLKNLCLIIALFTASTLHAQPKGLLWQITGKGIKQPTYLFGTIHMFDTTLYKLPNAVMSKLSQTKQVYFELDFGKINAAEMMSYVFVKDSTQQLNKLLDQAALTKLNQIAKTIPTMQAMGTMLYKLKPIFLTSFLLNNGNAVTIDAELYKRAVMLKDSVGGLETVAEQMQAIDVLTIPQQAQLMQEFLKVYTSADDMIKKLTQIYVKQDIENMLEEMNNDMPMDASFNEALLIKRNVIMANRIDKLLGKQSTMVAVGAGHLAGQKGLIALLKAKGYQLKNVPFNFVKAK